MRRRVQQFAPRPRPYLLPQNRQLVNRFVRLPELVGQVFALLNQALQPAVFGDVFDGEQNNLLLPYYPPGIEGKHLFAYAGKRMSQLEVPYRHLARGDVGKQRPQLENVPPTVGQFIDQLSLNVGFLQSEQAVEHRVNVSDAQVGGEYYNSFADGAEDGPGKSVGLR